MLHLSFLATHGNLTGLNSTNSSAGGNDTLSNVAIVGNVTNTTGPSTAIVTDSTQDTAAATTAGNEVAGAAAAGAAAGATSAGAGAGTCHQYSFCRHESVIMCHASLGMLFHISKWAFVCVHMMQAGHKLLEHIGASMCARLRDP